jgi:tetratricopeptide (TPR) repeat protein
MNRDTTLATACLVVFWLVSLPSPAQGQGVMTFLGPSNRDLYEGSLLLKDGEAEEGLKRTLRGLEYATTIRDKVAGMSNACAAYVMLKRYEEAVPWCDQALELRSENWRALVNRSHAYIRLGQFEKAEADLEAAEKSAPGARSVKLVRSMYLDATDPVAPAVIIDDRRQGNDDEPE